MSLAHEGPERPRRGSRRLLAITAPAAGVLVFGFGVLHTQAAPPETSSYLRPRVVYARQQSRGQAPTSAAEAHRSVLNKYCVTCHNQRTKTAGLTLDTMELERVGEASETWEKVVRKLRSGAMPPAGSRRPDKDTYDSLASWLETALDRESAVHPNPGRRAVHRLNR